MNELIATASSTVADMLPSITAVQDAYASKDWMLLAGLVLTAVVALVRKLGIAAMLSPDQSKWLAVGLSMAGAVGGGLMLGMSWHAILVTGLSTGLVAIGGWETLGKLLRGK